MDSGRNESPSPSFDLVSFLASTELLGGVPRPFLEALAAEVRLSEHPAGHLVLRQGDPADAAYLVVEGSLEISVPDPRTGEIRILNELGAGSHVGEMGVFTGEARVANARAMGAVRLVRLPLAFFDRLGRDHPEALGGVSDVVLRRVRQSQLAFALHLSRLFGSLEDSVLRALERELELVTLAGGEALFRQGDGGGSLFVVVSGRLRVAVEREDGEEQTVAELGQGETVGEMAVLSGEHRAATVYAARDTHLAKLPREGFERLMDEYPLAMAPIFTRRIVARLRERTAGQLREASGVRTIAVVAESAAGMKAEFCERMIRALEAIAPARHLSSQRVDGHFGKAGAAQAVEGSPGHGRLVEWLNQLEGDSPFVLYETDADDSRWTRRCLRQADHVIVLADPAADPIPGPLEIALGLAGEERARTATSLVLVHREGGRPSGSRRWLQPRRLHRHHHIHLNSASDIARIARFITGRAVGLVLGGGFARGIAHAGVIRALRETGVPIDVAGGTSMGAIVAAECVLGYDYDRMIKRTSDGCASAFSDLTPPFVSLLSGRKLTPYLTDLVGDLQIEDLWLPYFCVSANLSRARFRVHDEGPLVKSLLASSRAPGIFPPVVWDGDLLVDGGVMNNLPADVMKSFSNEGTVIAVDVTPKREFQIHADWGLHLSGWRLLRRKLNPFARGQLAPGIYEVLMRTLDLGGTSHKQRILSDVDLLLPIPLGQFKANDFRQGRRMAELAYRHAQKPIEEWLRAKPAPWTAAPDGGVKAV